MSAERMGEYEQFLFHKRNESGISALFSEPKKGVRLARTVVPEDDEFFELNRVQTLSRLQSLKNEGLPHDQTKRALDTWPKEKFPQT
jgi:hypothetical protein